MDMIIPQPVRLLSHSPEVSLGSRELATGFIQDGGGGGGGVFKGGVWATLLKPYYMPRTLLQMPERVYTPHIV